MFEPKQLGREGLSPEALARDRRECRRIGPCGVGALALYLNSFYFERRYYVPLRSVSRVFKRVAMSRGGYSGRGLFATMPYLVVVYDDGREKQCNFKFEEKVDALLDCLRETHPEIKLVSAPAEKRLRERERQRAARKLPELSEPVLAEREKLLRALAHLEKRPELTRELSEAARRRRAFQQSRPGYRWVAAAVGLMGLIALGWGVWALARHIAMGTYVVLFGLAAIFLVSSAGALPTAKNNRKAILQRDEAAQAAVAAYLYPDFPVPARYAHENVLRRMIAVLEEGRAKRAESALNVVKKDLQAVNASVEVEREEFDEIMSIKALFLNADYK